MSNGERGGFVLAAAVVMLAILAGAPTWAGGFPSESGRYRYYVSVSLGPYPEETRHLLR